MQKTFIREKRIYCGRQYREVDIFPYSGAKVRTSKRGRRAKKTYETPPGQQNLNDRNAKRYLVQLSHLNFAEDPDALHVTATYDGKHLPETVEQAEREVGNYLRRIQYRRKKEGLPPLKYILVTAYSTKKGSDKPVRIHHHILMNGGLNRDTVEDMWRKRRKKGQKQGKKIGYVNADRLQKDENGITALCHYLAKQPGGKKRWSSSHNLKRPYSRSSDEKYTRRQVEKWARERPSREFWERKYPGWTPTSEEYGTSYEYNELTGWAIYLKLRKKE